MHLSHNISEGSQRLTLPAPRHEAVHCLFSACECIAVHTCEQWLFGSLYVSRKLPTYPSPKPTFCPQWEVSVNVGLYSCLFMSIEGGENKLLLLLCFYSCFTIFFFQMTIYIFIYQSSALHLAFYSLTLTCWRQRIAVFIFPPFSIKTQRKNKRCQSHARKTLSFWIHFGFWIGANNLRVPCSLYCYRFEYLSVSWFISVIFVSFSPITFLLILVKCWNRRV